MDGSSLAALRLGQLRQRALQAGVSTEACDRAVDEADDPKQAIIELIMQAQDGRQVSPRPGPAQLAGLRLGELKKRAKAGGASTSAIEAAIDQADDPKAAVIDIILDGGDRVEEGIPALRPAYQPEPEPEPEPEPPQSLRSTWSGPSGPANESLAISSVSSPGLRSSMAMDFSDVVRDSVSDSGAGGFAKLRGTLHNPGEMQRVRSHLTTLQGEHD